MDRPHSGKACIHRYSFRLWLNEGEAVLCGSTHMIHQTPDVSPSCERPASAGTCSASYTWDTSASYRSYVNASSSYALPETARIPRPCRTWGTPPHYLETLHLDQGYQVSLEFQVYWDFLRVDAEVQDSHHLCATSSCQGGGRMATTHPVLPGLRWLSHCCSPALWQLPGQWTGGSSPSPASHTQAGRKRRWIQGLCCHC